jgi:isocitrate lyase
MRSVAAEMGEMPFFDWDSPRAREGYYRVLPSTEYSIKRAEAFAPHSDLLWMETAAPDVAQAQEFARRVRSTHPGQWLAYNLSPSFNWDAGSFSDDSEIEAFTGDLADAGYVWQFITLAGFHSNGLISHQFAQDFSKRGMRAYVETIQRAERDCGAPMLKHQLWSGAELMDDMQAVATGGGSSTASMGAGVTESQFESAEEEVAEALPPLEPSGFLPTSRTAVLTKTVDTKHHSRAAAKAARVDALQERLAAKASFEEHPF